MVENVKDWYEVDTKALKEFIKDVFVSLGLPLEHADIVTDVLVAADMRGIPSHGVARLRRYVKGIREGLMRPGKEGRVIKETPVTLLIDGEGGLGQVVAYKAMNIVIKKAHENGVAFASIRNSNHYGIAAYYSMMALDSEMIGISMTNAAPLVVPTFGKTAILGTNPISVAFPVEDGLPVVLDMATSTVPRGKLEVYQRMGKKIPLHWATDEKGFPTDDPEKVLNNLLNRRGGGLLPLGGAEEETGGHKGYGLAFMVDIFTGVLSGGTYGLHVYESKDSPPGVCHFLGAIKVDSFIDAKLFKSMLSMYIKELKSSDKAQGHDRIFIHGEKEFEMYEKQKEKVTVYWKVIDDMQSIAEEVGVRFSLSG